MRISDRAKQIVSAIAPTLGATLGGPLGGLAGQVLSQTLGVAKDDPKALESVILSQSPDVIAQIRLAEIELQKSAAANDLDLERINASDRSNAREREIKQADPWTPRVLAAVIVAGFLMCVYMVLGGHVQGLQEPLVAGMVGTLIGYASAKADQVVSYYFGSSASSKSKDDTLAHIAKQS